MQLFVATLRICMKDSIDISILLIHKWEIVSKSAVLI